MIPFELLKHGKTIPADRYCEQLSRFKQLWKILEKNAWLYLIETKSTFFIRITRYHIQQEHLERTKRKCKIKKVITFPL